MAGMNRLETTPIPQSMRKLDRDHRGYPVPWIVMRDIDGKPVLTVNDHEKVQKCVAKKRCSICGRPDD